MTRRSFATAMAAGATVWGLYGVVEGVITVLWTASKPLIYSILFSVSPRATAVALNTGYTAFALIFFPIFGALLNAAAVTVIGGEKRSPRFPNAVAMISLIVIATAYAAFGGFLFVIPIGAIAMAQALLYLFRGDDSIIGAVTNPVTTVLVLVAGATVAEPHHFITGPFRILFTVVALAVIVLVSLPLRRVPAIFPASGHNGRKVLAFAGAAIVILIATFFTGGHDLKAAPVKHAVARAAERPNVIVITLDSVRADHLSLYGYSRDTSPELRRFAAGATLYRLATSAANHTLASHASMFTGQPPSVNGGHRIFSAADHVAPHKIASKFMLAELLSQRGYRTAAYVANTAYLLPVFGFDRGFDVYDYEVANRFLSPTSERPYLLRSLLRQAVRAAVWPSLTDSAFLTAPEINAKALGFVEDSRAARQPFFLFLNYMDAHSPYLPPPPFDRRFAGWDPDFRWFSYGRIVEDVVWQHRPMPVRAQAHLISQYDGAIAYLDSQVGALLAQLRRSGAYDDTLIVITSDHGEAFGESHVVGHGFSLYRHQINVPLVIKYPHRRDAEVVDAPVSALDLLPTVMDVVGDPMSTGPGMSLCREDFKKPRTLIAETYHPRSRGPNSDSDRPSEIAFMRGSLKEIAAKDRPAELYDLASDPNETKNLYGRMPLRPELQAEILAYVNRTRGGALGPRISDPEVLNRLRSLGYLR